MTSAPEPMAGIVRVAPFSGFFQRFDELIGSATQMVLYFIHSRRWRENHDAALKAFLARGGTTLEVFLPGDANGVCLGRDTQADDACHADAGG